MRRCEHRQNSDEDIVARWRKARPPPDNFGENIPKGGRAVHGKSHRMCHPSGVAPRSIANRRRNDGEPALQTRHSFLPACRHPPGHRSAVRDESGADAHEARSDRNPIAATQAEPVEVRQRDPNSIRKVRPVLGQQRPHLRANRQICGVTEHAVNNTVVGRFQVERWADGDGLDARCLTHEIALMKLAESETHPKIPP
jgi:hypothetical protein